MNLAPWGTCEKALLLYNPSHLPEGSAFSSFQGLRISELRVLSVPDSYTEKHRTPARVISRLINLDFKPQSAPEKNCGALGGSCLASAGCDAKSLWSGGVRFGFRV